MISLMKFRRSGSGNIWTTTQISLAKCTIRRICELARFCFLLIKARAFIRRKQNQGEFLAELTSRIMKLVRIAYQDAGHREGNAVQVQLTEYFVDALSNSFIKEDVARANPVSLSED